MISDENKSVITTMLKKLREVKKTEAEIKAILIQAGFIDAEIESLIKLNPHPSPEEKLEFLKREMQNNPEPEQEVPKSFFEQNTPETPLEQKTTVPENTMPEPETTPKPNIPTQTPINNPKQNEQKNIEFSLPPLDKKVFGNEAEKEVPEDDFLKPTSQKPEQQTPEFILDSSSTHPTTNPIPSTQEKTTEFQTLPSTPSTIPTSSTIPSATPSTTPTATPSTTPTATPSTTPTSTPSIPPAPSQSQNQPQQNSNLNLNPTKHFEDPLDSHKKGNTKTNPLNSNIVKIGLIAIITLIIIIAFIGMTGLGNTTATTSTPNNNNLNPVLEINSTISLANFSSGYQPRIIIQNNSATTVESDIYTLYVDENECAQTLSTIKEIETNEKITFYFNEISEPCQFADNSEFDMDANHEIKITSPNGTEIIQTI